MRRIGLYFLLEIYKGKRLCFSLINIYLLRRSLHGAACKSKKLTMFIDIQLLDSTMLLYKKNKSNNQKYKDKTFVL